MAFRTLADLRARLNTDLGIVDGDTKPFGDEEVRNAAIRHGFERLWPTMKRLVQETVVLTTKTYDYDLTTVQEVVLIEQLDSSGYTVKDIKNYRSWVVDDDPVACRLRLPNAQDTTQSLVVSGYAPYISDLTANADSIDLQERLEWIPLTGARAWLYRRRFHEWLDFEQYNAENPSSVIDPATLYQAYQDSERLFETAKVDHAAAVSMPKRARLER